MGEQAAFPFPHVESAPPPVCGAPGPRGLRCALRPHADGNHSVIGIPTEPCHSCGAPAGEDCADPAACCAAWQLSNLAPRVTP